MKKRFVRLAAAAAVLVAVAAVIVLVLGGRPPGDGVAPAVEVSIYIADLALEVQQTVEDLLTDFNSLEPSILPVLSAVAENADVRFVRGVSSQQEALPWRGVGYRLYAFLPTLADLEDQGPIILPLQRGELDAEELRALLARGSDRGLTPLAIIDSKDALAAWNAYDSRIDLQADEFIEGYANVSSIIDGLYRRRILFAFWPDQTVELIQESRRPQFRGFPVPGSRTESDGFLVGEVTWLELSPGGETGDEAAKAPADAADSPGVRTGASAPTAQAAAVVKYLTSPGVAVALSRSHYGEFYSWPREAQDEDLPEVAGPGRVLSW